MKEKNKNKMTREEMANSSVKSAVDSVYDLIMANAMFILFNIHILIFLLFFRPDNIAGYYLVMAVLSLNLLPSYTALYDTIRRHKDTKMKVVSLYIEGYRKGFKNSFIIGTAAAAIIFFSMFNSLFFFVQEMDTAYFSSQLGIFFTLFAAIAAVPALASGKNPLRTVLRKTKDDFFRLLLSAALAAFIIGASVFIARYIIFTMIFGFSLAVKAQMTLLLKLPGSKVKNI